MIWCDSSSEKKASSHLIIDKYYLNNSQESKNLYKYIIKRLENYKKYIDKAVYSRLQQMRLCGSSKIGGIKKQAVDETTKFWQTIITNITDNFEEFPDFEGKENKSTEQVYGALDISKFDEVEECFLEHLPKGYVIGEFSKGYYRAKWEENNAPFCPVCERIHSRPGNVPYAWKQVHSNGDYSIFMKCFRKITKGATKIGYQKMNEEVIMDVVDYEISNKEIEVEIDMNAEWRRKDFAFEDFDLKWLGTSEIECKSEEEAIEKFQEIRKDAMTCFRRLHSKEKTIIRRYRDRGNDDAVDFISESKFCSNYSDVGKRRHIISWKNADGKRFEKYIFSDLLNDKKFLVYGAESYPYNTDQTDPILERNQKTKIEKMNIFCGFRAERVHKPKEDVKKFIEPILTHINNVFAAKLDKNPNWEQESHYILSWFSQLIQEPAEHHNAVMLSLISYFYGVGKTSFISWFGEYVLGSELYAEVQTLDDITTKFNGALEGKLLIYVLEMESCNEQRNIHQKMNSLKTLITDRKAKYEKKFENSRSVNNYARYIGSANEIDPFRYEEGQRRFASFLCSNVKNTKEYFENLSRCFNQEMANYFYTYLLDYDMMDIRDIPNTGANQKIYELSMSKPLRFILDVRNGDWELDNIDHLHDTHNRPRENFVISIDNMFMEFQTYCSKKGFPSSKDEKWFREKLSRPLYRDHSKNENIPILTVSRHRIDGERKSCWVIPRNFFTSDGIRIMNTKFSSSSKK